MLDPQKHKFHTNPALYIFAENARFSVGYYDKQIAEKIHPGVYAWTVQSQQGEIIPMYIGLYGQRATRPSLRNRFGQHLRGLNSALAGNPPTNHWRDCLVPAARRIVFDQKGRIDVYFGHFRRDEIVDLEARLIQMYRPAWNSRGL